jgi:hypothetical protein
MEMYSYCYSYSVGKVAMQKSNGKLQGTRKASNRISRSPIKFIYKLQVQKNPLNYQGVKHSTDGARGQRPDKSTTRIRLGLRTRNKDKTQDKTTEDKTSRHKAWYPGIGLHFDGMVCPIEEFLFY